VVRIKFQGRYYQIYLFGLTAQNFFFCIEHILSDREEFYSYDEEKYKEMIFDATEIVLGYFEFLDYTTFAKI
jgi:hypothetical protein